MRAPFLLALFLCAIALSQDNHNVTLPNSPEDLARGKKLFLGSCTYCHGPTGDGGKGADLSRQDLVRAKTDGDLARIIEVGIPGSEMPSAWHMTRREVTQVAAYVRTLAKTDIGAVPGDPAAGRTLYAKHNCSNCHTLKIDGVFTGGYMGPDLSSIGGKRNGAHLRESILDPAASLPDGFKPVKVTAKSGRTLNGRIVEEDTFVLVLRDLAGANHVLIKQDLTSVERSAKSSPMPSYKGKLSAEELDNLIAYLASLKEQL
jgi:cytochrome c oxidase cbb3-type subunit III